MLQPMHIIRLCNVLVNAQSSPLNWNFSYSWIINDHGENEGDIRMFAAFHLMGVRCWHAHSGNLMKDVATFLGMPEEHLYALCYPDLEGKEDYDLVTPNIVSAVLYFYLLDNVGHYENPTVAPDWSRFPL